MGDGSLHLLPPANLQFLGQLGEEEASQEVPVPTGGSLRSAEEGSPVPKGSLKANKGEGEARSPEDGERTRKSTLTRQVSWGGRKDFEIEVRAEENAEGGDVEREAEAAEKDGEELQEEQ